MNKKLNSEDEYEKEVRRKYKEKKNVSRLVCH
jgi:hypothetical protein